MRTLATLAVTALLAGMVLLWSSCNRDGDGGSGPVGPAPANGASPAESKPVVHEPDPVDPATVGSVAGTVKFNGPAPERTKISLPGECRKGGIAEIEKEDVIVNANGTLRNVFVYIKKGPAVDGRTFPVPPEPVVLDQHNCRYVPHAFAIRAGQQLEIRNSDDATHNVNAPGGRYNSGFNKAMPASSKPLLVKFKNAENRFLFKCDMHPWMGAFCYISQHPYYSMTGETGDFAIEGLAPGKYTIEAIHELYGVKSLEFDIAPKERKTVEFSFK
jgi:plastocyanin